MQCMIISVPNCREIASFTMKYELDTRDPIFKNKQKPEILAIKPVAQTRVFKIEEVTLHFSNGEQRVFERLRGWQPGVVLVVPMQDPETLLLIQEYGAGINDYTLSFPKGRIEEGEDILVAGNREMQEEIGFKAKKLTYLQAISTAPNYNDTHMHILLAEDLVVSKLEGDEPEPMTIVPWSIHEIDGLLSRADFHESKSVAALFLAKHYLEKRKNGG